MCVMVIVVEVERNAQISEIFTLVICLYFWLCGSLLLRAGFLELWCTGFSLWWLFLLRSTVSRA